MGRRCDKPRGDMPSEPENGSCKTEKLPVCRRAPDDARYPELDRSRCSRESLRESIDVKVYEDKAYHSLGEVDNVRREQREIGAPVSAPAIANIPAKAKVTEVEGSVDSTEFRREWRSYAWYKRKWEAAQIITNCESLLKDPSTRKWYDEMKPGIDMFLKFASYSRGDFQKHYKADIKAFIRANGDEALYGEKGIYNFLLAVERAVSIAKDRGVQLEKATLAGFDVKDVALGEIKLRLGGGVGVNDGAIDRYGKATSVIETLKPDTKPCPVDKEDPPISQCKRPKPNPVSLVPKPKPCGTCPKPQPVPLVPKPKPCGTCKVPDPIIEYGPKPTERRDVIPEQRRERQIVVEFSRKTPEPESRQERRSSILPVYTSGSRIESHRGNELKGKYDILDQEEFEGELKYFKYWLMDDNYRTVVSTIWDKLDALPEGDRRGVAHNLFERKANNGIDTLFAKAKKFKEMFPKYFDECKDENAVKIRELYHFSLRRSIEYREKYPDIDRESLTGLYTEVLDNEDFILKHYDDKYALSWLLKATEYFASNDPENIDYYYEKAEKYRERLRNIELL